MIWVAVVLGVVLAVQAAYTSYGLKQIIKDRDERISELEDRLQAKSLTELRVHRPVAMPNWGDEPDEGIWLSDDTGMIREYVRRDDRAE